MIQTLLNSGKFGFQIQLQTQFIPNFQVAGGDPFKNRAAVYTVLGVGMTQV